MGIEAPAEVLRSYQVRAECGGMTANDSGLTAISQYRKLLFGDRSTPLQDQTDR
jgi:hypothetical protein